MAPNDYKNRTDFAVIEPAAPTPLEEAAVRSELAAKHRGEDPNAATAASGEAGEDEEVEEETLFVSNNSGTILEAAFVDPAYAWPPADGQGKNAIELQASSQLSKDNDDDSVFTTETAKERMAAPSKPVPQSSKKGFFSCCRGGAKEAVISPEQMREYEERKILAKEARKQHNLDKKERQKNKERALRRKEKYNRVPEGILIYQLNTSQRTLRLMSPPHDHTNLDTLVEECVIETAVPAPDKSRRALLITTEEGRTFTLTACEQRTATAWLEAIGLMHAKHNSKRGLFGGSRVRACIF